jgi:intermediate filament protein if
MSAKTTYQRSAKGPVAIAECAADGKSITLENTGRKEEPLGGWAIKRSIDGSDKSDYYIDSEFIIRPGAKIKLWAHGAKPLNAPATDLETEETSWGSGANINTRLVNPNGEDRATHVQKTIYT